MTMLNALSLVLLTLSILVFVVIPPPAMNLAEEIEGYLKYCSDHPQEIQELASLSLSVANKTNIPSELLLSTLIFESYNRPTFIRYFEKYILKLFIKSRKIGITRLPDFSIGLPQLKLTTALWINSDFKDPISLSDRPISQVENIINKLENLKTSVELAGRYLKRLLIIEQRLIEKSLLDRNSANKSPDIVAKVASKYQGGIPIYSTKTTKYGIVVSLISESKLVKQSLEKAAIKK